MVERKNKLIVIRLDAGRQKGMGHLFRMMNLANVLINDFNILFILRKNKIAETLLSNKNYDYSSFPVKSTELKIIQGTIENISKPIIWIYDILDTELDWIRLLKKEKIKVITIDDLGKGQFYSDLTIQMLPVTFTATKIAANIRSGIKYLIISRELQKYVRIRNINHKIHLGVSMGGSDTHGTTVIIGQVLNQLDGVLDQVSFFLGPSFDHLKELQNVLNNVKYSFRLLIMEPDIYSEMNKTDIFISNGGMTLFEVASMGIPIFALATEGHENHNIQFLKEQNACVSLGDIAGITENTIFNILKKNLRDLSALEKMAKRARKIISLTGFQNVTDEITRISRL